MDTSYEDSPSVVLGSAILAFVEIVPSVIVEESQYWDSQRVALAFTIKTKLQKISRRCKLEISWEASSITGATGKHDQTKRYGLIVSSS